MTTLLYIDNKHIEIVDSKDYTITMWSPADEFSSLYGFFTKSEILDIYQQANKDDDEISQSVLKLKLGDLTSLSSTDLKNIAKLLHLKKYNS